MPVAWQRETLDQHVSTGECIKAVPASVVPKPASGREPHSRCQTPLRGGGNLLRVPQRGGHHGGATIEAGHRTEPAPQPGQGLGVLGHPTSGTMCGGQAWPPWPKHLRSTHHEDPAEKQTNVLCATTVLFSTRLPSASVFSITHQAKDSLMPIPKGTLVFSGSEIWKPIPCQTFTDPSKVPRMASCQHQGASSGVLC